MINVCYCGNEGIFQGILYSALSVRSNTKEPLSIYLLTADITYIKDTYTPLGEKERSFLEKALSKSGLESHVYLIDGSKEFKDTFSTGRNMKSMYTPFAFLRLVMDKFEALPSRILYLDCDTLALSNIDELYNINLLDKDIGMVHDSMRGKLYCNSGVILFDLDKIKKEGAFNETRRLVYSYKLMMPDQDAINMSFKKKIMRLPRRFNEQRKTRDNTVIRHYCQSIRFLPYFHIIKAKPWQGAKFNKAYPKSNHNIFLEQAASVYSEYLLEK